MGFLKSWETAKSPKFVLALIAAEEWELAESHRSFSGKAALTASARTGAGERENRK